MDPERIGKFIRQLRKEHHLTQKQFADRLGVTYQAVSKWENGKNIPDILLLKKISVIYRVDIKELLDGEKKQSNSRNINKKVILFLLIFIIVLFEVGYKVVHSEKKVNDFEFKRITSTCEEFSITGSAAYNQDKTFIYISDVDYCGEENNTIYREIECMLYEEYKDTKKKIGTCGNSKKSMTLDEFLDTVELNVNNYEASCKMFTSSSLYLEIQALDESGKKITYQVPIRLEENCKKD